MWLGRGAAIGAVAFFLLVRGVVSVIVGPVLGETTPHFALFIVEGLVVEAVFLALPRARPLTLGLGTGVGIGTIGLASEWAWSNIWMPIPWTSDLLPGGRHRRLPRRGGRIAPRRLGRRAPRLGRDAAAPRRRETAPSPAPLSWPSLVGFAAFKPAAEGVSAEVTLTEAGPGEVVPTVRMSPAGRRRRRRVHQRHRLAGRRPRDRGARVDRRAGRLHHRRARPGRRLLEDDGALLGRQHAELDADLPARGSGDPGRGRPRDRQRSSGRSRPTTRCSSASRRTSPAG